MKFISSILITAQLYTVLGFSFHMHQYMGQLLQEHFTIPTSLNFTRISPWADTVRTIYPWSKPYHYIDIIDCNTIPLDFSICQDNCIYTAILNFTNSIKYNYPYINNHTVSFNFLLHFLQDMFQPLHVFGEYRGGNDYPVMIHFDNQHLTWNMHTNYHVLWDSILPEHILKQNESSIFTYNRTHFNSMMEVDTHLQHWLTKILDIGCHIEKTHTVYLHEYIQQHKHSFYHIFSMYLHFSLDILYFIFND